MALISMSELLEAGVHFGHRSSRWNPKMAPYIYTKRNLIHIIDLQQTVRGLLRATHFLTRLCSTGEKILLVGTKRQAKTVIVTEAKRCSMPYVAERWLGGTLTNFATIRSRLKRLHEIEGMERDGKIQLFKKKEIARIMREKRKLLRNLDGIRDLDRMPGAVIVVDPAREKNAVLEARKLGIPTIGIVDTNGDPDLLDIAIPANDDAMRAIKILLTKLIDAAIQGGHVAKERAAIDKKAKKEDGASAEGGAPAAKPAGEKREGDRGGRGGGRPAGGGRQGGGRGGRRGPRQAKVHPPRFRSAKKDEPEPAPRKEAPAAKADGAKTGDAKTGGAKASGAKTEAAKPAAAKAGGDAAPKPEAPKAPAATATEPKPSAAEGSAPAAETES